MPGLEQLREIPAGYAGTRETIGEMKRLVDQAKKKKSIITLARGIVHRVPERAHKAEVNALFDWVKRHIRFVNDVYGTETIQAPWSLVKERNPSEDCDGLSTTFNSLAAAIGYDTAFKTIKADPTAPHEFSHVYSMVNIDGRWVPADPSQKDKPLGWEPPSHFGSQVWGYSRGELHVQDLPPSTSLKGLGMLGNPTVTIRNAVANLFSGKKTAAPAPAEPKQPGRVINRMIDPPYDPEEHDYYGDEGGDGGGKYNMEKPEDVYDPGEAVTIMAPLARIRPVDYNYGKRNLDQKFKGRQKFVDQLPDATAIRDGSPSREETMEQF